MSPTLSDFRSLNVSLLTVLLLQFIFYAIVFLDIPIARQVFGFLYLTFLPGIILLKVLKLNNLNMTETILLSVGLSVAFLMLIGLAVNELCPLVGVSKPLSQVPLMVVINSAILFMSALACLQNKEFSFTVTQNLKFHFSILPLLGLPTLSVIGAILVNASGNNLILLLMMIVISMLFAIGVLFKKLLPPKLYPLLVFMVAISLLYHTGLISNYIMGTDIHHEYFIFKATENNAHWSSAIAYQDMLYGRMNAMLSVTILPTIYSSLLHMDATQVLKILYPLIFSFVPLGLYQIWQPGVGKKYALISAFLFMAQVTFYNEMPGLNRQMVAELFLVLLFLVILSEKIKPFNKMVFSVIFGASLIVSHYSVSVIFLFLISVVWIYLISIKWRSKKMNAAMVLVFFTMMFAWDIYTSNAAAFDSMLTYGNRVYNQMGQFFNLESRGPTVLRGLGMEAPPSIWNMISRMFAYLTEFLIVVGFIALIMRRAKIRFDRESVTFTSFAMALLVMLIIVPGFAETLNMTRFYHLLLFFLAPLCALGLEVIVKFVTKRKTELVISILVLAILIPYFLFQTSFMYEVTGSEAWSASLSKYRIDSLLLYGPYGYVDEQSVFGARWMSENIDVRHVEIYADKVSRGRVLTSYGMIYGGDVTVLSNTTLVAPNGALYLSKLNVVYGKIIGKNDVWNSSELSPLFDDINKVYSNGGCEIYVSVLQNS